MTYGYIIYYSHIKAFYLLFRIGICGIIKKDLEEMVIIMSRRDIQRKRTMTFFIDAAREIIEKEGIKGISIRKVADKAGFNSATLYNYFENLDHLIFLAAMRYIKDYVQALPEYIKEAKNSFEKFLMIWECFCKYSFKSPEIYYSIFFAHLDNNFENYVIQYYNLFPEDLENLTEDLSTMLLRHNIYRRNMITLKDCIKEGFFNEEEISDLNELVLLTYEGMLFRIMKGKDSFEETVYKTMKYIKQIVKSYQLL